MTNQLHFTPSQPSWRLDRKTQLRGIEGVAAARAVLLESRIRAREAALAEGESLELHVAEAA